MTDPRAMLAAANERLDEAQRHLLDVHEREEPSPRDVAAAEGAVRSAKLRVEAARRVQPQSMGELVRNAPRRPTTPRMPWRWPTTEENR